MYSGTYGANGSTYRTELETFSRITATGTAGNGPASFTVELKDGLIREYGINANSRILSIGQPEARAWTLSRISDRAGNSINVTWHNDTINVTDWQLLRRNINISQCSFDTGTEMGILVYGSKARIFACSSSGMPVSPRERGL